VAGFPPDDPVHALVPHTLTEPIEGAGAGPLAGLSFMAKDLFAIEGHRVSNGNPCFYEHAEPAAETAPVVRRLLDAGASCTGITICDEFFYSVLGDNVHYGQPRNPRAPRHVTGGSSCGSAAAVAASMCDFALGSDTGGSIRVPASFCGLYGLRPTHGRISLEGVTPMAPTFDTVGFLARDAELLRRIGHLLLEGDRIDAEIERIVLAEDIFVHSEASADQTLWRMLEKLKRDLPKIEHRTIAGEEIAEWRDAFRIIQGYEIQDSLLPFIKAHSHEVNLGPGVKERFEAAGKITTEETEEARRARARVAAHLRATVELGTVIVLPTTPTLPPERDIPDGASFADFRTRTLGSTCLAGLGGLPQISIPAGEAAGCPVGLSFIAWRGGDEVLLDLAVKLAPLLADSA
jgi:amidase